jgi:hypothetical protein
MEQVLEEACLGRWASTYMVQFCESMLDPDSADWLKKALSAPHGSKKVRHARALLIAYVRDQEKIRWELITQEFSAFAEK